MGSCECPDALVFGHDPLCLAGVKGEARTRVVLARIDRALAENAPGTGVWVTFGIMDDFCRDLELSPAGQEWERERERARFAWYTRWVPLINEPPSLVLLSGV